MDKNFPIYANASNRMDPLISITSMKYSTSIKKKVDIIHFQIIEIDVHIKIA